MSSSASGSGWHQGLKTDPVLMQTSRLTSISPRKTGSQPPGASTRGEPANKKQKISSKETLVESTEDSGDSDDPLDTFKWTKKSIKSGKTYGRSRTIGRTGSSVASSPNNPSTATTSRTTKKSKEIIDVDDSPPPKPPSRPRPRTKAKPAPKTDALPDKEAVTDEKGGDKKARRKVEHFPLSISQTRTRSASPSSSSEKGKAKASDFPMDFSSSEQVPRAASFPQPSPECLDEGDDTIMLTSPKRNSRPEVAPFPMTATQFGSPPTRRPGKSGHGRSDSQFSSYRSNDEEIISDSNPEKENMSPPGSISLSSSKRRSSEPEDGSDIFAEKKKKRKKEATIVHTSSDSSLLPTSTRTTLPSSPPPPSRLCPFCDEPLPRNISTRLKTLIDSLVSRTHAAPRPGNPLGRDAPLALSINVCSAHRAEAQTIPQGLKKGWPRKIDFKDLPRRMKDRSTRRALEAIVNIAAVNRESKFWTAACNDIRKRGARVANSVQGQMETFHLTQPGYYGEQGFLVISEALQGIFPQAKLEAADIAPMNSQDFLRRVLVPETAILLIMEDMGQDYPTALKTMEDSREYGTALFPAKDNDGDVSFDLSFRVDSPPKPVATSAGKMQKQLKGKDSPKQKTAPQRVTRGQRSPIFSKLDSDEETEEEEEEEEEDRQEKGKAKKIVLVRNSSAQSSQLSSQWDRSPKPLPKPSGIRKVSERRTDTNSVSSEREVLDILYDPRASASVTSTSKGSSSGSRPKFIRPPARSPPPPPLRSLPVPIQVPQLGTSKPLPQRQNQPATKKPPPAKGKGKGKVQNNGGSPELDLILLGRGNPLPSLNPNSQKHRQAGGHHLEKGGIGHTKNSLISASTSRIGLSRPQKVGLNRAKERSTSAAIHPTVSTPKKLPADNVEILVDTPSDKMRRTYVRTPEHFVSKSSRKSPARFSRPQRRKPLSSAKTQHTHLRDDDEPEDIDSDSGGSDLPDVRWNAR